MNHLFAQSPTSEPAHGAPEADPFQEAVIAVQALREIAILQANELAASYLERREELQKAVGTSFIGVGLYVRTRSERRSVQLDWTVAHFRRGVHVGSTPIKKTRGSPHYDLGKLRAETPGWAYDLVVETEHRARAIREALLRLTEMDQALDVAARRLQDPEPLPPIEHFTEAHHDQS